MDIGKYHLQLCQRYALVTTSCANLPECINDHINLLICELRLQMAWKFHHVPNDGSTKPHLICEKLEQPNIIVIFEKLWQPNLILISEKL